MKITNKDNKEMHFDKIIMNPPYNRSLHLKILRKVINMTNANEIVSLQPVRFLQDPLAEIKGNRADYGRFADIRSKITSLEAIPADKSPELFGTLQAVDLGIYYLTPEGGLNITPKSFISQALLDKVNKPTYEGRYKSIGSVCSPEGKPDFTRPDACKSSCPTNKQRTNLIEYRANDTIIDPGKIGKRCGYGIVKFTSYRLEPCDKTYYTRIVINFQPDKIVMYDNYENY